MIKEVKQKCGTQQMHQAAGIPMVKLTLSHVSWVRSKTQSTCIISLHFTKVKSIQEMFIMFQKKALTSVSLASGKVIRGGDHPAHEITWSGVAKASGVS